MKLNNTTNIDLSKLIDTKLLIQANSGGGKSWLIRRILEQSHGKVQHIILDPEGEFGTLREKYDYILAGKGGDTPAEPRSAALLAKRLLELKVSAIIDLYELHPQERKKFVRLFLEAMVNAPKELWHPVLVVIDEAHTFVPEKGESEAANAVIGLASLGRKRGFGAILATQRISKLHKDAAAECNNKLIGRTGLDIDRKRAGEELGFTGKDEFLSLRSLKPGEFYAFGPAISDEVKKVEVGTVQTSHPKAGSRALTQVVPPTEKIKNILGKLADLPAEAHKEAQTVAELKQQIKELTHQLRMRPTEKVVQEKIKTIEVSVLREKDVTRLEKVATDILSTLKSRPPQPKTTTVPTSQFVPKPVQVSKTVETTEGITGPEQRILDAIAWLESIGVSEPEATAVAFLAGYTFGGGGFNNPRGALRTKGLVEYRGSNLALTDSGRALAQIPNHPLTQDGLHEKVLSVLPGPEQRLLRPLLECYPNAMSNEELAQLSGYQVGSGGFNNPKGRLRTLGLVEYPQGGQVRARSILFL